MRRNIDYKGLTRLPSDHTSFDGEMEEVFNLVNVNGELRPYVTPDQIGTLSGRLVFIHKNEGWEHFITLDGANIKAYTHDEATGTFTEIGTIVNIYGEEFRQIEQIGNTLIILTDYEVKYAMWQNDVYRYIGNQLPFPRISFSLNQLSADSKWLNLDGFSEDIDKLWRTDGYSGRRGGSSGSITPWAEPVPGTSSGRYDKDGNPIPGRTGTVSSSGSTAVVRESVVSTDFENMVRGAINKQLEAYRKSGKYIFPFFIRYALRLYDGTLTKHSPPILMTPTKFYPFVAGLKGATGGARPQEDKLYVSFQPSELKYSYQAITGIDNFKDIITSVDVFMSEPIYTYEQDGVINGVMDKPDEIVTTQVNKILGGIYFDKDTTLKNIAQVGQFYKILSIPLEKFEAASGTVNYNPDSTEYLVQNELMTDEYQSHHRIIAESVFVYNHKIHLSGIEQFLFAGFSYGGSAGFLSYHVGNLKPSGLYASVQNNPFIYYPDARGTLLVAKYGESTAEKYKEYPLSAHTALNGSFYLNPSLDAFNPANDDKANVPYQGYTGKPNSESLGNTLFVSTLQNPFVFPASGRVTLPLGKIIAVASNTQAISAGQFGQFPLYLFTDDGIWTMEVSTDGRYMTRQPISREVAINRNILQMDRHIAFISKKGLMILSGTETECISDIIREVNTRSSKLGITSLINALDKSELQNIYNTVTIEEYMKDAELAHEYLNGDGRIYLINRSYPYSYMFDIRSKSWSKVAGRYRNSTNNYPDCYVQNTGGDIFNLASLREETGEITAMYISRPIRSGDELFSLTQVYQTGIFRRNKLATCIYASRDGLSYQAIASSINQLLLIKGSPYKYYKIVAIADLMANESLSYVTIDTSLKYTNRIR